MKHGQTLWFSMSFKPHIKQGKDPGLESCVIFNEKKKQQKSKEKGKKWMARLFTFVIHSATQIDQPVLVATLWPSLCTTFYRDVQKLLPLFQRLTAQQHSVKAFVV